MVQAEGPLDTDRYADAHFIRSPCQGRLVGTKIHEPWHRAESDQKKASFSYFAQRCHYPLNCVSSRCVGVEGGDLFYVPKGAI